MPTYRLDIEYDGTEWHGWQIQPNLPTVQGAIESALQTALRFNVSIVGSGRTDAGVHASGQVAHFHTDLPIDSHRLMASLNGLTPNSIAIRSIAEVQDGFHARFDALSRTYRYRLSTLPVALDAPIRWYVRPEPDFERMNLAANHLIGTHNFSAFCKVISDTENKVCTISEASWRACPDKTGSFDFVIRADRYLHGMVRAIVGTLIEIGQGKRDMDSVPQLIASQDRTQAGFAAPPHGLSLEKVVY